MCMGNGYFSLDILVPVTAFISAQPTRNGMWENIEVIIIFRHQSRRRRTLSMFSFIFYSFAMTLGGTK